MAGRLHVGVGQVVKKRGHALVFGSLFSSHYPQTGTANDGVLRGTGHVRVVGQSRQSVAKFGVLGHVAIKARGGGNHRALARDEAGLRHVGAALVNKQPLLGHVGEVLNMAYVQGRVRHQTRVQALHAVAFGGQLGVVPRREALQLCPPLPGGGEWALVAAGLELGRRQRNFRPSGGRVIGVQSCGLEGIFVDVENRGGAVERETQHLAVGGGVVARHCGYIGAGVKFVACVFHHLAHGHHSALAGHHGGCAHLKHLQNMRRIAPAKGRHSRRHGLVVGAFVGGHNTIVLLLGVEFLGQVIDPFVVHGRHGVPELDVGLGISRSGCQNGSGNKGKTYLHENS